MKIGAVYPQIELNGDPEGIKRIGLAAEQLGYDHVLMYDHVIGATHENRNPPLLGPYSDTDPFHDPFVSFGYLAGITSHIRLITGVLILPQRQTALVAKQATDVDLLSGGRLTLGVGIGWNHVEYAGLGESFETRGARLTEQIGYLRRLWSEPLVSFDGHFDTLDRGNILPRPRRHIPIYCGGSSEAAYRRAVKLADGFIFGTSFEKGARPGWERVKAMLEEDSRPLETFDRHWLLQSNEKGHGLSVADAHDKVRRWQDIGGTHASVVTMALGYRSVNEHIDHLAEFRHRLGSDA